MNGFTLWVLLAATGQVSETVERDKGWQINPDDGKLEYVVQIPLQKAEYMRAEGKEFQSEVPKEVAVRLSRVVVRISDDPIVSTPMEEVLRLPVVSKAVLADIESTAGPGRFSQLESANPGDVMHVGGGSAFSGSGSALPNAQGNSLSDQARTLSSDSLLAQNTLSGTPNKYSNTGSPPSHSGLSSAPVAQFPPSNLPSANTGIVGPTLPSSNYPTSPTNASNQTTGLPSSGIGSSGIGSSSSGSGLGTMAGNPGIGYSNIHGQAGSTSGQPYGNPSYPNQAGSYGQPTSTGTYGQNPVYNNSSTDPRNFGAPPRTGDPHQPAYNQYATVGSGLGAHGSSAQNPYAQVPYGQSPYSTGAPYGQSPYGQSPIYGGVQTQLPSDPVSLPSYAQPTGRVADNRANTTVPSTSATSGFSTAGSQMAGSTSPSTSHSSDPSYGSSAYTSSRSGVDNIVPVMFVLSLVVNFYLGMLIRKLLARYRSLLSSVRSQAV